MCPGHTLYEARPGAMTVQFGADAGQLRWHQKNWEGRKEKKEQREKENLKSKPCINRLNLAIYLTVSAHARLPHPGHLVPGVPSGLPEDQPPWACTRPRVCLCETVSMCTEVSSKHINCCPTTRYFEMTCDGRLNTRMQRVFQNQLSHFLFLVLKLFR